MAGESLERIRTRRRGAAPLASNSAARIGPKAPVAPVRKTFWVMSSNPFIGHRGGIISTKRRLGSGNGFQSIDKRFKDAFASGVVKKAGLPRECDVHLLARRGRAEGDRQQRAGRGDADVFD